MTVPSTYSLIIQEDSAIEYAQALFYFLSSILSGLIAKKFLKNSLTLHGTLYAILAVGLLFISLEEISWGQRIFNIPNSDYFAQHNVQREISLHNLNTVAHSLHQFYMIVGAYGAFSWILVGLFMDKDKTKCQHLMNFIVPEWFISSYFFFVFFIYTLFDYIRPFAVGIGISGLQVGTFLQWRDQEPTELLLSLGFLTFTVSNYNKLKTCLKNIANKAC